MRKIEPTRFRVRYSHCDRMGVVYHVNYLEYFEWARSDWIRQALRSYSEIEDEGYFIVVIEAQMKFVKPAHYEDILSVKAAPIDWENSRIAFQYEITNTSDDSLICNGITRHCFTNSKGKPVAMPGDLKKLLSSLEIRE